WATRPAIPVKVHGMALLSPPGERLGFYARGSGQVQRIEARVGERVQEGQRLLVLDRVDQSGPGGGDPQASSPQVRTARLGAIEQQLAVLGQQDRALDQKQAALESRRNQIETTNRPVVQQVQALDSLRRDDVIARYSPLWVSAQDLMLRNKAELASVNAGEADLRSQRLGLRAQAAELRANRAALEGDALRQVVISPVGGRVLDLAVEPGQPVSPGQRLGSLARDRSERGRLAVVLFTAADAVRLRPGHEVGLSPQLLSRDSFGGVEQRYGVVPGKLLNLSPESVSLDDVAAQVGGREAASHLMAAARQRSFGEGGDLTSQLPDRTGTPLVLAVVELESAATPSGLRWSLGDGPQRPLPQGTPAEAEASVEQRSLLSYISPFWRWLTGSRP
ncbi:MAG: HlyD family efflux transporter periplasmic adaptor subunit, partial [Cyanobium sp.]